MRHTNGAMYTGSGLFAITSYADANNSTVFSNYNTTNALSS